MLFGIDHGDLIVALEFGDRALRNQQRAVRTPMSARTLAYWPGRRVLPGLGNRPVNWIAPVVGVHLAIGEREAALSADETLPSARISSSCSLLQSRRCGSG